jgi:hypothetical protein
MTWSYAAHLKDLTRCALCSKIANVRQSHIVPKFCFAPLRDAKNRMHLLTRDRADSHKPFIQDAPKHDLLCDGCEGLINDRYEKLFKQIWFDHPIFPQSLPDGVIQFTISNPAAFKLFHLSVLWRAGAAAIRYGEACPWSNVVLHRHEPQLRAMLLDGDSGSPDEFPFSGYFPVFPDNPSAPLMDLFIPPSQVKVFGMNAIRMQFAGVDWIYILSSHMDYRFSKIRFQPNGLFSTMRASMPKNDVLHQIAMEDFTRRFLNQSNKHSSQHKLP